MLPTQWSHGLTVGWLLNVLLNVVIIGPFQWYNYDHFIAKNLTKKTVHIVVLERTLTSSEQCASIVFRYVMVPRVCILLTAPSTVHARSPYPRINPCCRQNAFLFLGGFQPTLPAGSDDHFPQVHIDKKLLSILERDVVEGRMDDHALHVCYRDWRDQ